MKIPNKKNKLLIPLLIVVSTIWGIIIFRVIDFFSSSGKEEIIEDYGEDLVVTHVPEKVPGDSLSFIELERDPFLLFPEEKKNVVKPPVQKKVIRETIPGFNYSVNGVIINDDKKMVILEDLTDNSTQFLYEGESYKSITIKSIEPNELSLYESGELKKIKIQ